MSKNAFFLMKYSRLYIVICLEEIQESKSFK